MSTIENTPPLRQFSAKAKMKIVLASLFGLFTFFISFKISATGPTTILVDHIANFVKGILGERVVPWVCVAAMVAGAIQPFMGKMWREVRRTPFSPFLKL